MKIVTNTLEAERERWDDPGDYPSNAGAGPLPSFDYLVLNGEAVLQLEPLEVEAYTDDPGEFVANLPDDLVELPTGVQSVKYDSRLDGDRLTLTPTDHEAADHDDYGPDDFDDGERLDWREFNDKGDV